MSGSSQAASVHPTPGQHAEDGRAEERLKKHSRFRSGHFAHELGKHHRSQWPGENHQPAPDHPGRAVRAGVHLGQDGSRRDHIRAQHELSGAQAQRERHDAPQPSFGVEAALICSRLAKPRLPAVPTGEQASRGEAYQNTGRRSRRLAAEQRDDDAYGGKSSRAVSDRCAAEPHKVLSALQDAEQHRQPKLRQAQQQSHVKCRWPFDLQRLKNGPLIQENNHRNRRPNI